MTSVNIYSLRMVKETSAKYDTLGPLQTPENVAKIATDLLELDTRANEAFYIFCLNTKNKLAGIHPISQGSLNSSIVHPREVFKAAILNNSSAIILLHNHPSGDPEPSRDDIETTERLSKAGTILGIKVLDHIVIGENGRFVSLKEKGLM